MDVDHLETGIYIRELKDEKWQSLDLSELTAVQRARWYTGLTKEGLIRIVEQYVELVNTLDAYFPRKETD